MTAASGAGPAGKDGFSFSPDNEARIPAIIAKYPEGRQASAVMALLDLAQRQEGHVSQAAMDHVAQRLAMAPIRVYEVATFYSMFRLRPTGACHLMVCTGLPCMLRGSEEIVAAVKRELGIGLGETTSDGMFSLAEVECLGACVNAPVAWIGDDYYEDLDVSSILDLIRAIKRGERPSPGPANGRQASCPAGGATTLSGQRETSAAKGDAGKDGADAS